jgi:protein-S-isoprenylcysteine O-methyltransferase Ste14
VPLSALEARVPPPLAALVCGVIAWLVSRLLGPPLMPFYLRVGLGAVLFVAGLLIAGAAARTMSRARTTLNPVKPETATALVTTGIFGRTRNPMYLGMASWLAGWAVWLATPAGLLGPALFVLWMNRLQIAPEERALGRLFGAEFEAYKARVGRWF